MWLPKDERRLLAGYYGSIGEIGKQKRYCTSELTPLLMCRQQAKSASASMENMLEFQSAIKLEIANNARIDRANKALVARNMLTVRPHESEHDVILVALTH